MGILFVQSPIQNSCALLDSSETSVYMTLQFLLKSHSLQCSTNSLETREAAMQLFCAGPTSVKSSASSKSHAVHLSLDPSSHLAPAF